MKIRILMTVTTALLMVFAQIAMVPQAGCETGNSVMESAGFPYSVADLAERAKPAVVNISGSRSKCQHNDSCE